LREQELLPKFDRISLISILRDNLILPTFEITNSEEGRLRRENIRSVFGTIAKRNNWEILLYLLENGAITSIIAWRRLNITPRSAWRSLEELRDIEIIEVALRNKIPRVRGVPANVYRLPDATVEQVRNAVQLHNKLFTSKKFRLADNLAQTILEEFKEEEIKEVYYKSLFQQVKALCVGYNTSDITDMVATILHERGVRIWR